MTRSFDIFLVSEIECRPISFWVVFSNIYKKNHKFMLIIPMNSRLTFVIERVGIYLVSIGLDL